MAAQCAGCLGAITPKDKFVLSGTEVFHRQCIANIANSVSTRQQLRIIELHNENHRLKEEAREAARLRTAIDDANRDARNVRADRDNVRRNLDRAISKGLALTAEYDRLRADHDQLVREVERVRADRDLIRAARDRLVREETDRNAGQRQTPDGTKTTETVDDTRARFALLELD